MTDLVQPKLTVTRMAVVGLVIGALLIAAMLAWGDVPAVLALLAAAGPALILPILLHIPQTVASAAGWRPLIAGEAPTLWRLFLLRWVGEAINALLPVAQVGGDVVRGRMLARRTGQGAAAAASCTLDLAMEMGTEVIFALFGLSVLLLGSQVPTAVRGAAVAGIALTALVALSFLMVQKRGLGRTFGPILARFGLGADGGGALAAFDEAVTAMRQEPGRRLRSAAMHLVSWGFGAVEVWAGMQVLGLHGDWRAATVVESLGQIVRAAGFLVPGALGIQEGGYVALCALFAIPADGALALALVRRARELALGLPGLVLWRVLERRA